MMNFTVGLRFNKVNITGSFKRLLQSVYVFIND